MECSKSLVWKSKSRWTSGLNFLTPNLWPNVKSMDWQYRRNIFKTYKHYSTIWSLSIHPQRRPNLWARRPWLKRRIFRKIRASSFIAEILKSIVGINKPSRRQQSAKLKQISAKYSTGKIKQSKWNRTKSQNHLRLKINQLDHLISFLMHQVSFKLFSKNFGRDRFLFRMLMFLLELQKDFWRFSILIFLINLHSYSRSMIWLTKCFKWVRKSWFTRWSHFKTQNSRKISKLLVIHKNARHCWTWLRLICWK